MNVAGEMFEIAAWKKQGRHGEFLSIQVKPKQQGREEPARQAPKRERGLHDESDIPF